MTWGPGVPADPTVHTNITKPFYQANIKDPINHLRALIPDPSAVDQVPVSTALGATPAAVWKKIPTAALADGAVTPAKLDRAYLPLAGGAMAGTLTVPSTFTIRAPEGNPLAGGILVLDGNVSAAAAKFDISGGLFRIYNRDNDPNMIAFDLNTGALSVKNATVWRSDNDGAGSNLDSDLLDGQQGLHYLARGNHTGTQLAATISDLATAVAGLAAASAAAIADGAVSTGAKVANDILTAAHVNSTYKDGAAGTPSLRTLGTGAQQAAAGNHGHTGLSRIASGTYTGNGSSGGRQITTGFTVRAAWICDESAAPTTYLPLLTTTSLYFENLQPANYTTAVHLHGSDGFVVGDGGMRGNNSGSTYRYVAIG